MIHKSFRWFSTLNAQYLANRTKNAVRFDSQNIDWDYEELNYQSLAPSKGVQIIELFIKYSLDNEDDNILIRVPHSLQSQSFVAKLGTSIINVNLINSQAKNIQELDQEISANNIKGIIFQPTLPIDSNLAINALNQLMPEIKNQVQGSQIRVAKYPSLSTIVQTNFYSYPGVFKFRSILNYASEKNFPLNLSNHHEPIVLPDSSNPIIITNPVHNFAFRAGILNSVMNGRFIICVEPQELAKVANIYKGKIDLIATEEGDVSSQASVFVEKGSTLYSSHGKRIEL